MRKTLKSAGFAGILYALASGCGQQGLQIELPGRKIQRIWPVDDQGLVVDSNIVFLGEDRNGDGISDIIMYGIDANNDNALTEDETFETVLYGSLKRPRGVYPLKEKASAPAPTPQIAPVQAPVQQLVQPPAQTVEQRVVEPEKVWDGLDSLEKRLPRATVLFSSGNAVADSLLMAKFQNLASTAFKAGVEYNHGKSEDERMNVYLVKEGQCYPISIDEAGLEIVLGEPMELSEMYEFERARLNRANKAK